MAFVPAIPVQARPPTFLRGPCLSRCSRAAKTAKVVRNQTTPNSLIPAPQPPNSATPKGELPQHVNYQAGQDRVVLFDGECVLCNRGVDALLNLDRRGDLKLAALQSKPGYELAKAFGLPTDLSTVVYVDRGVAHIRSDAILRLGASLENPLLATAAKVALITVPRPVRDFVYTEVVARNRYWMFGSTDECRMVQPGEERRFIM